MKDNGIDSDGLNGRVLTSEISGITKLDVNDKKINDLTGIEGFTSLIELRCVENQLTSLDISNNTSLELFLNNSLVDYLSRLLGADPNSSLNARLNHAGSLKPT